MTKEDWQLKQIADFFYLLVDGSDATGKDILQSPIGARRKDACDAGCF